jgi:hypothetical protein
MTVFKIMWQQDWVTYGMVRVSWYGVVEGQKNIAKAVSEFSFQCSKVNMLGGGMEATISWSSNDQSKGSCGIAGRW